MAPSQRCQGDGSVDIISHLHCSVKRTVPLTFFPGIRLLAIGGVAPTVENIGNGSYPFTEDFYIVTARPLSENAKKLRDWFVSDEGQRFIAEVGYVPLRGKSN